jgi:hypothetical protein
MSIWEFGKSYEAGSRALLLAEALLVGPPESTGETFSAFPSQHNLTYTAWDSWCTLSFLPMWLLTSLSTFPSCPCQGQSKTRPLRRSESRPVE